MLLKTTWKSSLNSYINNIGHTNIIDVTIQYENKSISHSVVSNSLWSMDCSLQVPLSIEFSRQEYWSG